MTSYETVIDFLKKNDISTSSGTYASQKGITDATCLNKEAVYRALDKAEREDVAINLGIGSGNITSSNSQRTKHWTKIWTMNDRYIRPIKGVVERFFHSNVGITDQGEEVKKSPREAYSLMKSALSGKMEAEIRNLNEEMKKAEKLKMQAVSAPVYLLESGRFDDDIIDHFTKASISYRPKNEETIPREIERRNYLIDLSKKLTPAAKKIVLSVNLEKIPDKWKRAV